MIMVSKHIEQNQANVTPLGLIDIDVLRTGYGRQVHSFDTVLNAKLSGNDVKLPASFIRAPIITRCGEQINILAVYDENPVLVEKGNILAGSFHSELDENTTLAEYFLNRFLLSS